MQLDPVPYFENHWFSNRLFNVFLYFHTILRAYGEKAQSPKNNTHSNDKHTLSHTYTHVPDVSLAQFSVTAWDKPSLFHVELLKHGCASCPLRVSLTGLFLKQTVQPGNQSRKKMRALSEARHPPTAVWTQHGHRVRGSGDLSLP